MCLKRLPSDSLAYVIGAEMKAHVRLSDTCTGFIAELDDGRRFERADLLDLSGDLHAAGVTAASALCGDWRGGDKILMAGQKIALKVELRRLATNN
jgi:hypothetical protein